jgi:hypothetical protein
MESSSGFGRRSAVPPEPRADSRLAEDEASAQVGEIPSGGRVGHLGRRFPGGSFVAIVMVAARSPHTHWRDPMRYLLLIYTEEPTQPPSEDEAAREMAAYAAYTQELNDRGVNRGGEALQQTTSATTVRVRNGETVVTDGPFAETKEALGGFYLLDCRDLDEAIELAAKLPAAKRGSVEVRPIWELPPDYAEASGRVAATPASG